MNNDKQYTHFICPSGDLCEMPSPSKPVSSIWVVEKKRLLRKAVYVVYMEYCDGEEAWGERSSRSKANNLRDALIQALIPKDSFIKINPDL